MANNVAIGAVSTSGLPSHIHICLAGNLFDTGCHGHGTRERLLPDQGQQPGKRNVRSRAEAVLGFNVVAASQQLSPGSAR